MLCSMVLLVLVSVLVNGVHVLFVAEMGSAFVVRCGVLVLVAVCCVQWLCFTFVCRQKCGDNCVVFVLDVVSICC